MIADIFFVSGTPSTDVFMALRFGEADDAVAALLADGYYVPTARLCVDSIGEVFAATNHIDDGWEERGIRNGTVLRLFREENRSSMVGDIVVTREGAFRIASVGYKRLPDTVIPVLQAAWGAA